MLLAYSRNFPSSLSFETHQQKIMDSDDEAPPELVETGTRLAEEEITVKVPITIVTGTHS
jgi:hypothetical protein